MDRLLRAACVEKIQADVKDQAGDEEQADPAEHRVEFRRGSAITLFSVIRVRVACRFGHRCEGYLIEADGAITRARKPRIRAHVTSAGAVSDRRVREQGVAVVLDKVDGPVWIDIVCGKVHGEDA